MQLSVVEIALLHEYTLQRYYEQLVVEAIFSLFTQSSATKQWPGLAKDTSPTQAMFIKDCRMDRDWVVVNC